jgi:DNA/RNA-binding domain of Phe-tRNA-synthetase-like protein
MFGYDDAVARQFPAIRAGVIHATGLANGPSSPALLAEYRAEQQATSARLAGAALADLPSIAAWRRVFTRFGAKPTQYRNAAEALLRRLTKHGGIPSLNTLADIGNLVSIRYAMPAAVVDRAGVAGSITVRFATGGERFDDLGSSGGVAAEPGEVIFTDERDAVAARRWCWRQSVQSATTAATTEALIIVEGHHESAARDATAAIGDLTRLLGAHQPASRVESFLLSPASPVAGRAEPSAGELHTSGPRRNSSHQLADQRPQPPNDLPLKLSHPRPAACFGSDPMAPDSRPDLARRLAAFPAGTVSAPAPARVRRAGLCAGLGLAIWWITGTYRKRAVRRSQVIASVSCARDLEALPSRQRLWAKCCHYMRHLARPARAIAGGRCPATEVVTCSASPA